MPFACSVWSTAVRTALTAAAGFESWAGVRLCKALATAVSICCRKLVRLFPLLLPAVAPLPSLSPSLSAAGVAAPGCPAVPTDVAVAFELDNAVRRLLLDVLPAELALDNC